MLVATAANAQDYKSEPDKQSNPKWYAGAQVGMWMGESEFSSFASDKFRAGVGAGIHGGYRFSEIWGLEISANWGSLTLSEQERNAGYNFFLGDDWQRYSVVQDGQMGYYYNNLLSKVFVQRYGLHVSMNLLGMFEATKGSQWRCELVPAIYATSTSADVVLKDVKSPVRENITGWHLGYGVELNVLYALNDNIDLGIYGGFTHHNGNSIDGLPNKHPANYIADVGVRVSWKFGRSSRDKKSDKTSDIGLDEPRIRLQKEEELLNSESVKSIMGDYSLVEYGQQHDYNYKELIAKFDSALEELGNYINLNNSSDRIRDRYNILNIHKECVETYAKCYRALTANTYDKSNIDSLRIAASRCVEDEYFGSLTTQWGEMREIEDKLANYERAIYYFADLINTVNKSINKLRSHPNESDRIKKDIVDKFNEVLKGLKDNSEIIGNYEEIIGNYEYLGWLFDGYKNEIERNPKAHTGVEAQIARMLGLDCEKLKGGEYRWDKNTQRLYLEN